jgi:hypothetical protein
MDDGLAPPSLMSHRSFRPIAAEDRNLPNRRRCVMGMRHVWIVSAVFACVVPVGCSDEQASEAAIAQDREEFASKVKRSREARAKRLAETKAGRVKGGNKRR